MINFLKTLGLLSVMLLAINANAQTASPSDTLSDELQITISAKNSPFKASEALEVEFTITNISQHKTLKFLNWKTPLEGFFSSDIFRITGNQKIVPYAGRTIRRGAAKEDQYITLAAGESISAEIDLAQAYELSDAGAYTVRFDSALSGLHDAALPMPAGLLPQALTSNTIRIALSEERSYYKALYKAPAFAGCSASQQTKLIAAENKAEGFAVIANNDLQNASLSQQVTSPRYIKWFGTHSSSNFNKVKNTFNLMQSALVNTEITYLCDCTPYFEFIGVLAYVFSNDEYNIHTCNNMFNFPTTGSDTQAGTIIHELSHFLVIGGTDDHVYGEQNSINLAKASPTQAIDNAENYLFFAENTPGVAMAVPKEPSDKATSMPPVYLLLLN